ncbi:hypothetical protein QE152_g8918 [Popillia japonica]|uniref:Transposable element P transposase-like GTP-binding insertion domain-containing protein n=1 Tax=Popillia japonica TaxID=7064 RepID=A0AAW1M115_POPJA
MKVSMCSQVFSHTVSSAINLMAKPEHCDGNIKMPKRAIETAEFLKFFDTLFDSLKNTLAKQSVGANCAEDGCDILLTLKKFISANTNKQKQAAPRPTEYTTFQLPEDVNTLKPLQESALAYVAGYKTLFKISELQHIYVYQTNHCKKVHLPMLLVIKHYLKSANCNIFMYIKCFK